MAKSKIGRITPELDKLLRKRSTNFNTSLTTEQRNLVKILNVIENEIGVDFTDIKVKKDEVYIKPKRLLFRL